MADARPLPAGSWTEHAEAVLVAAGFRRGGARRQVIDVLSAQPCALAPAEIAEALRRRERGASRASVYRILDELEQLKLVSRVEVGRGVVRYEAVQPHGHHHHHLVCDDCGAVAPFSDDELERTIHRVAERVPFAVAEHEVVLHGACSGCRRPEADGSRPAAA